MKFRVQFFIAIVAVVFASAILTGCETTDPANVSSRPWNSPQGWSGLPSNINEGR
jgi:hypothetical protein